jgi:hypothetical protein
MDKGIQAGNKKCRTIRYSILLGLRGPQLKYTKDRRKGKDFRTTRWIIILQGIALGPQEYIKYNFTY